MKLKKEIDIVLFLREVKNCGGNVYLQTDEGDRLNLKSVLSQYIFAVIAEEQKISEESRIICSREDAELLAEYLVL